MNRYLISAAAAAIAICSSVGSASALVVGFERISANGSVDAAPQLSVEVTDSGAGSALFDFTVMDGGNPGANVAEIYFDDDAGLFESPLSINFEQGTSFTAGSANPGNLPGGNTIGFGATAGLLADAQGPSINGLTVSDMLILELTYLNGVSFSSVESALLGETLRIGLHVRSLLGGFSDGFVNQPPNFNPPEVVPLPATLPLLLSALAIFGYRFRNKRSV